MADLPSPRARAGLAAGAVVLVVLLTLVRGPVVLQALAAAAVGVALIALVPVLVRRDDVDWAWFPRRADDVPPEPGIATLRRTLQPEPRDTGASERLHDIVTRIADDRAPHGVPPGPLATYLAAPPRPTSLEEVERLVTELEALSPGATRSSTTQPGPTPADPSRPKENP
ncbi:hypothetical protein [Phycicoccus duodecadis]|uniref:Uncharacterized protein n=1 Tax=Phycicoccus duodecadis TaxID=173053 RepID=A0A2N3YMF5_9MICO|nr:hypothetical protein [Phycicoccus duodecadis]PKW28040.1 hypothetical protein ATL31_2895 [Phycicoccus duodecadis]